MKPPMWSQELPPPDSCSAAKGHLRSEGGIRRLWVGLEGGEEEEEEGLAQQEKACRLLPRDPFGCCGLRAPSAAEVDDDNVVLRT